jgi:hypothetical protein
MKTILTAAFLLSSAVWLVFLSSMALGKDIFRNYRTNIKICLITCIISISILFASNITETAILE